MIATTFVRARMNEKLKIEAANVLRDMGLTVSDVIRIVLTRIANEKALPFELRIPNKLTAETLEKSERGEEIHEAKNLEELFEKLEL
jgi:DNA-damage-inducible protein J